MRNFRKKLCILLNFDRKSYIYIYENIKRTHKIKFLLQQIMNLTYLLN